MKFREVDHSQLFLLPPSINDWLPERHLARFICDVVGRISLKSLYRRYRRAHKGGAPAYAPRMMVTLLFYAYCVGIWSSRRIERATYEDVAFRFICGNMHPDHDTICAFRSRHTGSIGDLFLAILRICRAAGMVKVGDVGLDGTKILANASGERTMSHERLSKAEERLKAQVEEMLRTAAEVDAAEDAQFGRGNRGDDLPEGLSTAEGRLAAIEAAKTRLEQRAREEAEQEEEAARQRVEEREAQERSSGKKKRGRAPQVKPFEELYASRLGALQVNVTDPDSQLMQDGATKAIVQAYNCQSVVAADSQIIIAASVTTEANDKRQLVPMLQEAKSNLGETPARAVADAGYFSAAAVTDPRLEGTNLFVSPSRDKADEADDTSDDEAPAPQEVRDGGFIMYVEPPKPKTAAGQVADAMRAKLRTEEGKQFYKARGSIVEGPFGHIKEGRGFRRFSMRGKEKADGEWKLVCLTHNLLKLWRSGVDLTELQPQTA
jgi:transposase